MTVAILRSAREAVRQHYTDALDQYLRDAQRLDDKALERLMRLLADARKEVISVVALTDWKRAQVRQTRERIERAMEDVSRQLGRDIRYHAAERYRDGASSTDELMERFGGDGERIGAPLDLRTLLAHADLAAEYITNVPKDTIADVTQALRRGAITQEDPMTTVKRIATELVDEDGNPAPGIWGDTLTRSEVIFRTEGNRVASVGQQARAMQHERIRPGLRKTWIHSGSRNPRLSHVAAAKEYGPGPGAIPVADFFKLKVSREESKADAGTWEALYPRDPRLPASASVMCFPAGTLMEGAFVGGLKAWYSGPCRELVTRRGHRLSVTSNHPILTPRGWIPAGELQEGEHLLAATRKVEAVRTLVVAENDQRGPAAIEDVLEALRADRGFGRADTAQLDLYGDEQFIEGDVEVVWSDRELRLRVESSCSSDGSEVGLEPADVGFVDVPSARSLRFLGDGVLSSRCSSPRRAALPDGVGATHSRPLHPRRVGLAAKWYTSLGKLSFDAATLNAERRSERQDALAAMVAGDDVSPIERLRAASNRDAAFFENARHGVFGGAVRSSERFHRFSGEVAGNEFAGLRAGVADLAGADVNTGAAHPLSDRVAVNAELVRQRIEARSGAVALEDGIEVRNFARAAMVGKDPAYRNARTSYKATQRLAIHAAFVREILNASAGLVSLDEVVEIRDYQFSGHVYDLEAVDGWMVANGVIVRNCGCASGPYRQAWESDRRAG